MPDALKINETVMGIEDVHSLVTKDFAAVNELILDTFKSSTPLINDIAHHVIHSGGKRLRCLLVLLASHACGYQGKEHIPLAAMIEFFHTATLLHDDVIDNSSLRRGQRTANLIWGNKASILVGDYLFTKYLELMVEVGNIDIIQLLVGIAPQMGRGEIQQFSNSHNPSITIEEYFDSIRAKTALLFAASTTIGALISKSDSNIQKGLYAYGLHLGNAFQLIDDALDYCSEAKIIGKNIGDDLANGKATLPLLHALKQGTPAQQERIKQSLEQGSLDKLDEILETLRQTESIEYTHNLAKEEINSAIDALNDLPASIYKTSLVQIAHYVIERNH